MTPLDNQTLENSITPMSKNHLRSIGGWMRFIAIVYIIFSVFGLIGAIGSIVSTSTVAAGPVGMPIPAFAMVGASIAFLILTGIALYLGVQLLQSANGFRAYAETNSIAMLEKGFVKHRTYLLLMGVLTIITLILIIIGVGTVAKYLPMIMSGALG